MQKVITKSQTQRREQLSKMVAPFVLSRIIIKIPKIKKDEWMHFSDNPLWPWCFGNAAVESKGDPPIRRIVKGTGHLGKIDQIHGLLDALYCFDWSEGRIER